MRVCLSPMSVKDVKKLLIHCYESSSHSLTRGEVLFRQEAALFSWETIPSFHRELLTDIPRKKHGLEYLLPFVDR